MTTSTNPCFGGRRVAGITVALAAVLLAAVGTIPAAQAQPPAYRNFHLSTDLELKIDGEKISDAEVYRTNTPPAFLVMSPRLPAPVLLVPGAARVETVNLMKIAKRPGGTIDLLPNPTLAPQGRFTLDGDAVVFTVEGSEVRLEPKPPLLGENVAADLKEYSPIYAEGAEAYRPDPAVVGWLRESPKPVRVRVFFGSWCPTCQRVLPHVVRLSDDLEGSPVTFEFYGLPQPFRGEPEATKYGITGVPTGVVFVDGEEAGRIEGSSWMAPETRIRDILNGAS